MFKSRSDSLEAATPSSRTGANDFQRSGRHRAALALLLSAALIVDTALLAQSDRLWLVYGTPPAGSVSSAMASTIYAQIDAALPFGDRREAVSTPGALISRLQRLNPNQTVFLLADSAALATLPETGWRELERTGLEPVSPRLWGRTLYVFANPDKIKENKPGPLKALVRWAGASEQATVVQIKAALKQAGFPNIDPTPMYRSSVMARQLDAGDVAVVAIYDEEPSAFLDGFVTALTRPTLLWLMAPQKEHRTITTVTADVATLTVPYDVQRFYVWPKVIQPTASLTGPDSGSVIIVPTPRSGVTERFRFPVLLTNARQTKDLAKLEEKRQLSRVVTQSYLRALFDAGISRCNQRDKLSPEQYNTALLAAYFEDRDNPYAVLGLLGHVLFTSKSDAANPDENYIKDYTPLGVLRKVLREKPYELTNINDAAGIVEWLAKQQKQKLDVSNARGRFAGYASEKDYTEAITLLKSASTERDLARRSDLLHSVRQSMLGLAMAQRPSTCGTPSAERGLWTGIDFEPFFYLAVIDAMLSEPGMVQ